MLLHLKRLLLLAAVCLLGARAEGKTLRFEEHDLEIEQPWDWLPSPREPGVLVVMHDQIPLKIGGDTSVGSRAASLMVATFPKDVAIDQEAFVRQQREAMQLKGAIAVGAGSGVVGPLTYYTMKLANGEMERPISFLCTTFGNGRAVTLVLSSRVTDPSTDLPLDAILKSLHFISPYRPVPQLTLALRVRTFVHRRPLTVAGLGVVGLAALVLLGMIVKQFRRP